MALIKKLTRIGNSLGIILPQEILKVVGLESEGECEIEVKNKVIYLKPHLKKAKEDQRVSEAMARFIKKYRTDLKKLAE